MVIGIYTYVSIHTYVSISYLCISLYVSISYLNQYRLYLRSRNNLKQTFPRTGICESLLWSEF